MELDAAKFLREENAKLREQLAALRATFAETGARTKQHENEQIRMIQNAIDFGQAQLQRAEAAEAKLGELANQEPFGYWHRGGTYAESDFFLASESGDVSCAGCVKLYAEPKQATPAIPEGWRLYRTDSINNWQDYLRVKHHKNCLLMEAATFESMGNRCTCAEEVRKAALLEVIDSHQALRVDHELAWLANSILQMANGVKVE
jgi:hypothetical protein